MDEKLAHAVETYTARTDRRSHPAGRTDGGGRWYPSAEEARPCCDHVRSPSRDYPWSYMTHCRTVTHVAQLYGVDEQELRRACRLARPPAPAQREGGEYYKAVARVDDGRLLSIYDGETEYQLGVEMPPQVVRRDHGGGYYVYRSAVAAAAADVPRNSALRNSPRVVLRVRAAGQYVRYEAGKGVFREHELDKIAFSRLTPLEVVETGGQAATHAA